MSRIRLKTAIGISIPAGVAFFLGMYFMHDVSRVQETPRSVIEQIQSQEVRTQSRLLLDSLWTEIDLIRSEAFRIADLRGQGRPAAPQGNLLHWAELTIQNEKLATVRQSAMNPDFQATIATAIGANGAGFETSYLESLPSSIDLSEIRENGVAIALTRTPASSSDYVALGFRRVVPDDSVITVLVDPVKAFPVFAKISNRAESQGIRAYLVGTSGTILAHSQSSYVGANFGGTDIYANALRYLVAGDRLGGHGFFKSIDQLQVAAGYVKAGTLPLGIVVERLADPRAVAPLSFSVWERLAGEALLAMIGLGLLVLGVAWKLGRREDLEVNEEISDDSVLSEELQVQAPEVPNTETLAAAPVTPTTAPAETHSYPPEIASLPEFRVPESSPVAEATEVIDAVTTARAENAGPWRELHYSKDAIRSAREERELLEKFESEAIRLRDPRAVAVRLTEAATRLCQSPTLFFGYQESARSAVVQAAGGFRLEEIPLGISFLVDDALMERIRSADQRGEIASVASYEPLARTLLGRLGVAHFEAWAVTGYGHLGRQAGKARLIGVLVIVQAGIESATRRDSIGRMLRTTGLVYENALLSRF